MSRSLQKVVPSRLPKLRTAEQRVALIEGAGRLVFACRDFDELHRLRAETEALVTYQRKLDADRRALAALEGCVRISEVQLGRILEAQKKTPADGGRIAGRARPKQVSGMPDTFSRHQKTDLRKVGRLTQSEIVEAVKAASTSGHSISQRETIALARLEPKQRKAVTRLVRKGATWTEARREVSQRSVRKTNAAEELRGRYSVILADPPWSYANTGLAGNVHTHGELPYPPMETSAICELPIAELATANAVLFLWVTNAMLVDGLDVVRAWGFEYRTKAVWLKNRAAAAGFYVRSRTEDLWICVRGRGMTIAPSKLADNVLDGPVREHSRKPDSAYRLIERYYPRAKKLELFARRARRGWRAWGNEIDRRVAS